MLQALLRSSWKGTQAHAERGEGCDQEEKQKVWLCLHGYEHDAGVDSESHGVPACKE